MPDFPDAIAESPAVPEVEPVLETCVCDVPCRETWFLEDATDDWMLARIDFKVETTGFPCLAISNLS